MSLNFNRTLFNNINKAYLLVLQNVIQNDSKINVYYKNKRSFIISLSRTGLHLAATYGEGAIASLIGEFK